MTKVLDVTGWELACTGEYWRHVNHETRHATAGWSTKESAELNRNTYTDNAGTRQLMADRYAIMFPRPGAVPTGDAARAALTALMDAGLTQASILDLMGRRRTDGSYAAMIAEAREGATEELEIDDHPLISVSEGGVWVSAWVYVADPETQESGE